MSEQEIIHKLRTSKKARQTFLANLQKRYEQYRAEGGKQSALKWALDFLGGDIWYELFTYKGSSYPISLRGLTRADGRRITRGCA